MILVMRTEHGGVAETGRNGSETETETEGGSRRQPRAAACESATAGALHGRALQKETCWPFAHPTEKACNPLGRAYISTPAAFCAASQAGCEVGRIEECRWFAGAMTVRGLR